MKMCSLFVIDDEGAKPRYLGSSLVHDDHEFGPEVAWGKVALHVEGEITEVKVTHDGSSGYQISVADKGTKSEEETGALPPSV